jgi:hypothetical protein
VAQEATVLIGVGAAKAGTSWLHRYLAGHPECHMRAIKELHFFDHVEAGTLPRHQRHEAARLLKARARQAEGDASAATAGLRQGPGAVAAYLGYLAAGRGQRRLVGDITPSYALLPVARLRAMAGMTTDVRFVYLLRDPVARLWSQARMNARHDAADMHGEATARHAMSALIDGIEQGNPDRADYRGTIARLRAAIAPERLLILLQEQMMSRPGLARLCRFLGIAEHPADFDRRENAGPDLPLPDDLLHRARRALRPQYDFAASLFPDLPANWRQNMTGVHG